MHQTTDTKPWYKHPWLWVLIMIPLISVMLSFTMLWVAITHKDAEVEGDWHKSRKAVKEDVSRDHYASALTITAQLNLTGQVLSVIVTSPYDLDKQARPATLNVNFSHPTHQAKDVHVVLTQQSDGSYNTTLSQPVTGRYYVDVNTSVWRLKSMLELPLNTAHTLQPAALNLE